MSVEHFALCQPLLERRAAYKLHPETNAAADLGGTKDAHQVRVSGTGKAPRVFEHARLAATRFFNAYQLESNVALQLRVVGAVDVSARAGSDWPDDEEVPPGLRVAVAHRLLIYARIVGTARDGRSVEPRNLFEELKLRKQIAVFGCKLLRNELPFDRRTIADRLGDRRQEFRTVFGQATSLSQA